MALRDMLPKRKKTIASLSLDDLSLAKVKLEQEQDRVMRRVTDLEKEKDKLFQQGVGEASKRQQLLLAQKIQELEFQARSYDKNLAAYQKQIRVLNGMIFLKENRQSWEESPVGQILGSMDLTELEGYVDAATANNVFQMDKFEKILGALEEGDEFDKPADMDEGVADIMAQMQRAREATSVSAGLEKLNSALTSDTEK